MHYVLSKQEDGRAWIHGGGHETDEHGNLIALGDYDREASPDEIIDGKRVREYPPGIYDIETLPPEPG